MKKDWYSPSSFMPDEGTAKFGANQIDWIIEHYEILIEGRWPQKSSGYIENPFAPPSKSVHASAYFETPSHVLAEFHSRIEACGSDGEAFICVRCLRYETEKIRRLMRINNQELDRILARVFEYILGRKKSRSYADFVRRWSPGYRGNSKRKSPPF